MRKTILLSTVVTATCSLLPATASATGFSTARFGGEHGHPTATNPTALYYNPAALGATRGIHVMVDGNIAFRSATYERVSTSNPDEDPEPSDGQGANFGKAGLFNVAAAPMLGVTGGGKMGGVSLGGGLGFFVPFGGSATWEQNSAFKDHPNYPGPVDGTQRWYSIHGTLRTLYASAGFAAGFLDDRLFIGVSSGLAISQIDSLRARVVPGAGTSLDNEGRFWYKGSSLDAHLGVGVMAQLLDERLRLGVSYQAPPRFGQMRLKGKLQKYVFPGNLNGAGDDELVELKMTLPDVIRFGASFKVSKKLELRAFGDFTRWSLFTDQCMTEEIGGDCDVEADGGPTPTSGGATANLPRRWDDAVGIRLGASYWIKKPIELFAGVGYDGNAIPDERLDPALTDFHDIGIAAGARMQFIPMVALAVSYTQLFYIERDTTGKSTNHEFALLSQGVDAGGIYNQSIGVLNINLNLSFDAFGSKPAKPKAALLQSW